MHIAEFQITTPLIGGLLIGSASILMLLFNGKIAGISGIAFGLMNRLIQRNLAAFEIRWRSLFVVGLVIGAALYHGLSHVSPPVPDISLPALIIGGLCVGLGTRIGSGCTSGHGVVGIGRLSVRSMVATVTFMAFGIATVFVLRHLLGVI